MSFLVPRNDDECDDGFTSLRGGTTKQSLSVRDCFGTIAHREIIMSSSVPRNDEESDDECTPMRVNKTKLSPIGGLLLDSTSLREGTTKQSPPVRGLLRDYYASINRNAFYCPSQ